MSIISDLEIPPAAVNSLEAAGRVYEPPAVGGSPRRPVFLAPTEDILIVAVALPLASARQRAQALPFAVEEMIAEPLSNVHIVMGSEISPQTHIAGVVSHELMTSWVSANAAGGTSDCRIIPDVFAVPAPAQHGWATLRVDDRVLVRNADGTGFAVAFKLLESVWQAAGMPSVVSHGEAMPDTIAADYRQLTDDDIDTSIRNAPIDLRDGAYAARGSKAGIWLRRGGTVVAAAALLHTLIIVADIGLLQNAKADREAQARELLQTIAPGARDTGDVVASLSRVMQSSTAPQGPRFLPLLARASEALQPFGTKISLQGLTFNETDGSLGLSIEGPTLGVLQALEQALGQAGLSPVSGPATTNDGAAQFRVTVHGGAAA